MAPNDSKSYLASLNKLVEQYNNTYHYSIKKNPVNVDYSALAEINKTNLKVPKFQVNDSDSITKCF